MIRIMNVTTQCCFVLCVTFCLELALVHDLAHDRILNQGKQSLMHGGMKR